MIRSKIRTLVVPVLGGLLVPKALAGTVAAATTSARDATSRRLIGAQRADDRQSLPQHNGTTTNQISTARRAAATGAVSNINHITDTKRQRRRRPAALFSLGAVGLALVAAGCGSATGSSTSPSGSAAARAPTTPAAPAAATPGTSRAATKMPEKVVTPKAANETPEKAAATKPDAGIPQGNGGDSDPDNNGGPNDGDGSI